MSHTTPMIFHVSPSGSDAGNGSDEQPFATLQRAQQAVRELLASGPQETDIVVLIGDGLYTLDATWTFDERDSGRDGHTVHYQAAPGAEPVISGGMAVSGWQAVTNPGIELAPGTTLWKASVAPGTETRQLFIDGERATLAETNPIGDATYPLGFRPTLDQLHDAEGNLVSGIQFLPNDANDPNWRDPTTWRNVDDITAVLQTQWKMMEVPLADVSAPSPDIPSLIEADLPGVEVGLITMQEPGWSNANLYWSQGSDGQPGGPDMWSFWRVSQFQNAYEFLDQSREWYLDSDTGELFLVLPDTVDPTSLDVQLPQLETLVHGQGVANLTFEGLTFQYSTWLQPGQAEGYVADQSGNLVMGDDHEPNTIGHVQHVERTPGALSFEQASGITFTGNQFLDLGSAGLDLQPGAQNNVVAHNLFHDIAAAAIQVGGVSAEDARPADDTGITRNNQILENQIIQAGSEFLDAAGIFVGFAQDTLIEGNYLHDLPWSGVAMGWGWGLLDEGGFAGLDGATPGMWGPDGEPYTTPTIMQGNQIVGNTFSHFVQSSWDGGAIYTTGFQGTSLETGTLIADNIAYHKHPDGGSNLFYTDGGTRFVTLEGNLSVDNQQGRIDFGPVFAANDPLNVFNNPLADLPLVGNLLPYGSVIGGCDTYGDIHYHGNLWESLWQSVPDGQNNSSHWPLNPIFYDPCHTDPVNLEFADNRIIATNATQVVDTGVIYRLYDALGRLAEADGLRYWLNEYADNASVQSVGQAFMQTDEFLAIYGNDTDPAAFVAELYETALQRAPDSAGLEFWTSGLESGLLSRLDVVIGITSADENL